MLRGEGYKRFQLEVLEVNKKNEIQKKKNQKYSYIIYILRCFIYIDNLVILIDVGVEEYGDIVVEYIQMGMMCRRCRFE